MIEDDDVKTEASGPPHPHVQLAAREHRLGFPFITLGIQKPQNIDGQLGPGRSNAIVYLSISGYG